MKRDFFAVKVLLLGLVTAQVIATIQVYVSNVELYRTVASIRNAGYLAIPNHHVMQSLLEPGTALCGGLFFVVLSQHEQIV